ncbi:hypothetical protein [Xanthomonas sp. NCPPB 2632]|uniref:hypothetical protein n=1 Tax=Xanthomonas sp. NCPPB 2632 TaxID=3240912 RepID=UPI0035182F0B
MSKLSRDPSPAPQLREDRVGAYNLAAATHPGACVVRVVDVSGACVPRDDAFTVAAAPSPTPTAKRS